MEISLSMRAVRTNETNMYRRTEREKTVFGVLINMIYRIGHQAGKAGGKVLEKRAGGGGEK